MKVNGKGFIAFKILVRSWLLFWGGDTVPKRGLTETRSKQENCSELFHFIARYQAA